MYNFFSFYMDPLVNGLKLFKRIKFFIIEGFDMDVLSFVDLWTHLWWLRRITFRIGLDDEMR